MEHLDESLEKFCLALDFNIGVAGYPEKHMEAASLEQDIYHLKRKSRSRCRLYRDANVFDKSKILRFWQKNAELLVLMFLFQD